jgi:glutathione S-transferase
MPTLYTMPGTCALAPNIAVAWLDAPVDVACLQRGDHKKDAYLAINPRGQVPALRFDDGDVLTEAAAILAWLGAAHGGEDYARDTVLGRREAEALSYMTSEVHAAFGPHFGAASFADGEAAQADVQRHAYAKLAKHFERLDATLQAAGEWYLGQRSFADAYLYVLVRWIDLTPLSLADYPALAAHRARMERDPGVQAALARQGMQPQA